MIHLIKIDNHRTTLANRIKYINILSDNDWEGTFKWDYTIVSSTDEKIRNDFNATKETWTSLMDKYPELNEFINDYCIIIDE